MKLIKIANTETQTFLADDLECRRESSKIGNNKQIVWYYYDNKHHDWLEVTDDNMFDELEETFMEQYGHHNTRKI